MILVVDDEQVHLDATRTALAADGHQVEAFLDAAQALERARVVEPALVVSDIRMPGLDGPAFRRAYLERFPGRSTPWIFLTALADPDDVVQGFECGADDYVVKGTPPAILRARVKALLRRHRGAPVPIFRGDLARFPFVKVLQFCELHGLTGQVDFEAPGFGASVALQAGRIVHADEEALVRLYDLGDGAFTIRAEPISFQELEGVAAPLTAAAAEPARAEAPPMGRLSGVRVRDRIFQIQTEVARYPSPQVLSVVILDGEGVLKRSHPIAEGADRAALERLIQEQHAAVEAEVRERLDALARARSAAAEDPMARYYRLFEEGLESFRGRDFARALELWRAAREANPEDRTLEVNIRVAEAKLRQP